MPDNRVKGRFNSCPRPRCPRASRQGPMYQARTRASQRQGRK